MRYIDAHCHLDFPDYGEDYAAVLGRMREKEVGAITIGTDLESSRRAVEIASENDEVWACIGVHPADNHSEVWNEEEFEKLVKSPKVVGIGECGLDFFRLKENADADKARQKDLFIKQIEFAVKHDKPLMLHCRNAYDEVLDILEGYRGKVRGNSHFFAGNIEQAKRFLDIGFTMSFTGVITFTRDYDEVIKFLPQDKILAETDAPFVAPVPYRGKRNEPSFVVEVVKRMAEVRGEEEELLRGALFQNTCNLFKIRG